jgi:hypothetical protein
MKLSQALRLLLQRQLSDHDINTAEELLRSYCTELITVRVCTYSFVSTAYQLFSYMVLMLSGRITTMLPIRLTVCVILGPCTNSGRSFSSG